MCKIANESSISKEALVPDGSQTRIPTTFFHLLNRMLFLVGKMLFEQHQYHSKTG